MSLSSAISWNCYCQCAAWKRRKKVEIDETKTGMNRGRAARRETSAARSRQTPQGVSLLRNRTYTEQPTSRPTDLPTGSSCPGSESVHSPCILSATAAATWCVYFCAIYTRLIHVYSRSDTLHSVINAHMHATVSVATRLNYSTI